MEPFPTVITIGCPSSWQRLLNSGSLNWQGLLQAGIAMPASEASLESKGSLGTMQLQCSYSGTSLNGPSQKRTTSLERTNTKAPIDFSMHLM